MNSPVLFFVVCATLFYSLIHFVWREQGSSCRITPHMDFSRLISFENGFGKNEAQIETRPNLPEVPPVRYDIDRMNKAVEEPGVVAPSGLSAAQVLAYFGAFASKKQ